MFRWQIHKRASHPRAVTITITSPYLDVHSLGYLAYIQTDIHRRFIYLCSGGKKHKRASHPRAVTITTTTTTTATTTVCGAGKYCGGGDSGGDGYRTRMGAYELSRYPPPPPPPSPRPVKVAAAVAVAYQSQILSQSHQF